MIFAGAEAERAAPERIINTEFSVLHEDEALLVIDKPSPLAVYPIGCYSELNLHSLLKQDPRWTDTKLHFAHRLDAETSGVIVIAKTSNAARFLGKQFMSNVVTKRYQAVVFGEIPETGDIDYRLGFDRQSGFRTVRIADPILGEEARTSFRRLSKNSSYSLVEVTPRTGRTHQIRVHLALAGHPIVGDKLYIDLEIFKRYVVEGLDEEMTRAIGSKRLLLHAHSIEFMHPDRHEMVEYVAPIPEIFQHLLISEEN